jgi:CTP synthase
VKELRSIGIQPDILLCRSEVEVDADSRRKIALFTNVEERAVVPLADAKTIYSIPRVLMEYGLDQIVLDNFAMQAPPADLSEWDKVVDGKLNPEQEVTVAMVGKYMELPDAYKSLIEALTHAGIHSRTKVNIQFINAEDVEAKGIGILETANAILVPGGFGERGMEGKLMAVQYARENDIPYLGICLGMQSVVIEFARNVVGWSDANSTEFDRQTKHPVIGLITEWVDTSGKREERDESSDLGGTMRLGAQECRLVDGSRARDIYGSSLIVERHRHRYEVNNNLVDALQKAGLKVCGWSTDDALVEMVELPDHPWFVASQFHPEFTSTPRDGHPLFKSYILAAITQAKSR